MARYAFRHHAGILQIVSTILRTLKYVSRHISLSIKLSERCVLTGSTIYTGEDIYVAILVLGIIIHDGVKGSWADLPNRSYKGWLALTSGYGTICVPISNFEGVPTSTSCVDN